MRSLNSIFTVISCLLFASLVGCGGGGGDSGSSAASVKLSGVAAVGTPIVNGTISILCANGTRLNTFSGSEGGWSVTVSGSAFPCAIEVSAGTIAGVPSNFSYHSVVVGPGTANITPLTDLIVANLSASPAPLSWYSNLSPVVLKTITITQVNTATANVAAALPSLPGLTGINNPITTAFSATTPNPMDDSLVALGAAITNSPGLTYSSLLTSISTATVSAPNIPSGFASALASAYSGTSSGTSSSANATYVTQGGLSWMPVTFGDVWPNANSYCANTTINGQTGWRLPTRAELNSLYASNAMSGHGWTLGYTWTSELDGPQGGVHWIVDLSSGAVNGYLDTQPFGVTCVH